MNRSKNLRPVFVLAWVLLACVVPVRAQIAGLGTLSVLDMASSARTAGLGMDYLSVWDDDVNVGLDNPALISSRYGRLGTFNYVGAFTGTNYGSLAYGLSTKKAGTFLLGMRFLSYGRFDGYDEYENPTGDFAASDYVLSLGWAMAIDSNFRIGAALKPALSQYDRYTALSAAMDLSVCYVNDEKSFSATLMARNFGAQLVTFDNTVEKLPFELSAALSYKLENAPFRVYAAAMELQRWNLMYDDRLNPTETTDMFGEVHRTNKAALLADNLFRHLLVGVEMTLGKAFYLRMGYNHRQAREIKSVTLESFNTSGFSFGLGFRVKSYEFAYARNNYHLGQAPNYISISKKF